MTHKHGLTGRILAMVLAMMMIVTSVPEAALTVRAAEDVETTVETAGDVGGDTDEIVSDSGETLTEVPAPEPEQPAEETTPADETTDDKETPAEEAPAAEETPTVEEIPAEGDVPAEEAPATEETPAVEETPAEGDVPAEETTEEGDVPAEETTEEEVTAPEETVELPEVQAGGSSMSEAVAWAAGGTVTGTLDKGQNTWYKIDLKAGELYFIKTKAEALDGSDADDLFYANILSENNASIDLGNYTYMYIYSGERMRLLGGADTDRTVYIDLSVPDWGDAPAKASYEMTLYKATVAYTLEAVPGTYTLKPQATVQADAAMAGASLNNSNLRMNCTYESMFGDVVNETSYSETKFDDTGKMTITFPSYYAGGVLQYAKAAGTEYEVEMSLAGYSGNVILCKDTVTATTEANDDLKPANLSLGNVTANGDSFEITYDNSKEGYTAKEIQLYYYPASAGVAGGMSSIMPSDKKFSIYKKNVEQGVLYEAFLYVDGVLTSKEYTFGEAVFDPDVKVTAGGFGAHMAYSVVKTDGTEFDPESSRNLYVSYRESGTTDSWKNVYNNPELTISGDGKTLSAETDITGYYAGDEMLKPDTSYDVRFALSTSEGNYTNVESFTTKDVWSVVPSKIKSTKVELNISLDAGESFVGLNNNSDYVNLYAYYRKAGDAGSFVQANASCSFYKTGSDRKKTMTITGLEPETAYEIQLRYSTYYSTVAVTLTDVSTAPDTRELTGVEVTRVGESSVGMDVSYTGFPYDEDTYINLLCRPVAQEGQEPVAYVNCGCYGVRQESGTLAITGSNLNPDTAYEYVVIVADGHVSSIPVNPVSSWAGTFKTSVTRKALSSVTVKPGSTAAEFTCTASNPNQDNSRLYFTVFYREKAEGEGKAWESVSDDTDTGAAVITKPLVIDGLKAKTEYEYKVTISATYVSAPDDKDVIDVRDGSFTTKEETRKLGDVSVETGINTATVTASFSGGQPNTPTYLYVFYKQSDESSYSGKYSYDTEELYGKESGTVEMTITGLAINKTYDYVVVLDGSYVGSYDKDATYIGKLAGTFTTKADARKITKADAVASFTRAEVAASFEGGYSGDYTTVVLYGRKSGDTAYSYEDATTSSKAADTVTLRYTGLEKETTYEYIVAISKSVSAPSSYDPNKTAEDQGLAAVYDKKEFKTLAESRKLGDVKITPGFTQAEAEVSFSGSYKNEYTYVSIFYRMKDTEDFYKFSPSGRSSYNASDTLEFSESGLEKGKTYEYVVLLGQDDYVKSADPTKDVGSDNFKEHRVIDKKAGTFATNAETREITEPECETEFAHAKITAGFTGGIKGENTYLTLFYREKGAKEEDGYLCVGYQSSILKSWEFTYDIYGLKAGKEYEYVLLLAGTGYTSMPDKDDTSVIKRKDNLSFKTVDEERTLIAPTVEATYTTLRFKTGFEGNKYNDDASIAVYYKESGTEDKLRYWKTLHINDATAKASAAEGMIYGLKPGTKYEYAVVFSDNDGFSPQLTKEDLEKIDAKWKAEGEYSTKEAAFEADIKYNEEKSTETYAVLDVKVTGKSTEDADNVLRATVTFHEKAAEAEDTSGDVTASILLPARDDYSAQLTLSAIWHLRMGVEYIVSKIDVEAYECGYYYYDEDDGLLHYEYSFTAVKTLELAGGLYTFTTKLNAVPDSIKLDVTDVYLNLNDYRRFSSDGIGYVHIAPEVSPATASTSFNLTPTDPEKGDVANWSRSANGFYIYPSSIGEVTYKVTSAADKSAEPKELATFTVHVVDYVLAEAAADGTIGSLFEYGYVSVEKGNPLPIAVYGWDSTAGEYATKITDAIVQENEKTAVTLEGYTLKGNEIGRVRLSLKVGNYPLTLYVNVTVPCTGFIIKDLVNYYGRPAILEGEPQREGLTATVAAGQEYQIEGFLSPMNVKISTSGGKLKYTVTSGDDKVLPVGGSTFYMSPAAAAYDAVIKVEAQPDANEKVWTTQTATITLHVKPVPDAPQITYVLTNVAKTLGDVKLAEEFPGWEWDEPDSTQLFNTGTSGSTENRTFKASYKGTDKYPVGSASISLTVKTMTDVRVQIDDVDSTSVSNRDNDYGDLVMQLKGSQAVASFSVEPLDLLKNTFGFSSNDYKNMFGESKYTYSIKCDDSSATMGIYKDAVSSQKVTFSKAGDYHFTISILSKSGTELAKTEKNVKVVAASQIVGFELEKAVLSDGTDVLSKIKKTSGENKYMVEKEDIAAKNLVLTVKTYDYSGRNAITDTKLEWKSSDTSVATISVDDSTRVATITKVGEGHTYITATAQDDSKATYKFRYQYQNKRPRVEIKAKKGIKVNVAYDTDTGAGEALAYSYGSYVEIAPVYQEAIWRVKFYQRSGATWDPKTDARVNDLSVDTYYNHFDGVIQTTAATATGKRDLWMVVTTTSGDFEYPLTIVVENKLPSVTAKAVGKINLFYYSDDNYQEYIHIKTGKDYLDWLRSGITLSWKDNSSGINGFEVGKEKYGDPVDDYTYRYSVSYPKVKVANGKLEDANVAAGTLSIKMPGVREVVNKPMKIAYVYKKPVLATNGKTSTIMMDIGYTRKGFDLYNKTESKGKNLRGLSYHSSTTTPPADRYRFTSVVFDTEDVVLSSLGGSYDVYYNYKGTKKSCKFTMTVDNYMYWREPLKVTHTIKSIKPKAQLSPGSITTNSTLDDFFADYIYINIKDYGVMSISDVDIQGVGATEQSLMEQNFINLYQNSYYGSNKAYLAFNQNAVKAMGGTLSKGVYKFKITPYYTYQGESKALNTVMLTIKVMDQFTAKTIAKGGLDIAKQSAVYREVKKNKVTHRASNVVKITNKLPDLPTDSYYTASLKGEYANFFRLVYSDDGKWYISFRDSWTGWNSPPAYDGYGRLYYYDYYAFNENLRAGMTIPLSIDYTIWVKGSNNNYYAATTLNGGTFNVKINQSAPKAKVTKGNNQMIYAAVDKNSGDYRFATITVPKTSWIGDISGKLDCNGDGKEDIEVYMSSGNKWTATACIYIENMDAVKASAKGNVVKIPVTVTMRGADRISKNSTTVIKMKVGR